jgi:phage FluMu protein Com
MIDFRCKNCGWVLHVPPEHAGKKGKCPKCGNVLTVPQPAAEDAGPGTIEADRAAASPYDLTLLDVPEHIKPPSQQATQPDAAETAYERLRRLQGGSLTQQAEQIPQRKLPWIIDILLYPLNRPGLTLIAVSAGIPFVLRILTKSLAPLMLVFLPALIFLVIFIILHWCLLVIFVLYLYWYVCECIRDSAAGGIRAPETVGSTPGLGDIFRQTLKFLCALIFFMSPATLYLNYTQRVDPILWTLYGCGGFLFPMGLLAVVMFDSLRGLSPRLILASIFSTFFQYCGLVIFWCGLCLLIAVAGFLLLRLWILGYVFLVVAFYLALILAHLLGRFFWKYQDKLNWEV